MSTPVIVLALDGAGAHPAAWRLVQDRRRLYEPARLVDLARRAEAGGATAVALDDSFDPPQPERGDLPFRLDALLSLAHVAAATSTIGLLATVTVTHTEPFHLSKNLATLDLVSDGRAAWRVRPSNSVEAAARFGRRGVDVADRLTEEAGEVVDVVRALWDSWEDDAVIRDQPTGRYIDRDKVHYVDFHGQWFDVRGPSITPRPPQGQPVVVIDANDQATSALAARQADVAVVTATKPGLLAERRQRIRQEAEASGRDPDEVTVLAEIVVGERDTRTGLDAAAPGADRAAGAGIGALEIVGDAADVAAGLDEITAAGLGLLLRLDALDPASGAGLDWLVGDVLPSLTDPPGVAAVGSTFRDRLGLARPANRFATAVSS